MAEVSPELAERIFAAIERDADLDGIATSSDHFVAAQVGVSHVSVNNAIRQFVAEGRVRLVGRTGRTRVLQLADST